MLSVVLEEVKHRNASVYQRLRKLCANATRRFFVFANENHRRAPPMLATPYATLYAQYTQLPHASQVWRHAPRRCAGAACRSLLTRADICKRALTSIPRDFLLCSSSLALTARACFVCSGKRTSRRSRASRRTTATTGRSGWRRPGTWRAYRLCPLSCCPTMRTTGARRWSWASPP